MSITASGARNVSLEFNDFHLADNAILSIYNKSELTDSITSKENNKNRVWATRVYQGNTLNIVLKEPILKNSASSLKISKVNFGFKKYGFEYGKPGVSQGCNINANCALGSGWDNEKNSVALIVASGKEWCSGALIMNTCNTRTPYLLTADHCLDAMLQTGFFNFSI